MTAQRRLAFVLDALAYLFIASMALLLIVILGALITTALATPIDRLVAFVTAMSVAGGVLLTVWTYSKTRNDEIDQGNLREAESLMRRAFNMMRRSCLPGKQIPAADRSLWLTVSRMLSSAEQLGAELVGTPAGLRYRLARGYWRSRLLDLFPQGGDGWPINYWAQSFDRIFMQGGDDRLPIAPESIRAIQQFLRWQDQEQDPLATMSMYSAEEIDLMRSFGPRGLADYLDARSLGMDPTNEPDRRSYFRNKFHEADAQAAKDYEVHVPAGDVKHGKDPVPADGIVAGTVPAANNMPQT